MRSIPRNLILVLAPLLLAAAVDYRMMAWSRKLSPIQHVRIHDFPLQFAEWQGVDYETEITRAARAYYGTDNFIDRVYSAPGRNPVQLVLLPVGAGLHSPKICARFGGLALVTERAASPDDPKSLDRIVLRSEEQHNAFYACSYYWQKLDRVAHEAKPYTPPAHYADSLLVNLCIPAEGDDVSSRFTDLDRFRDQVAPRIEALIGIRQSSISSISPPR